MAWLALTLRLVDGLKGLREGRSRDVHLWRLLRHSLLYLYLGLWSAIDIHGSGHRINRRSSSSVARPALALLQVRRRRYEDGQKEALSKKKNSKNRAKKKTKQKTKKKKKLRGDPRREI
ncbi:hypothetical protein TESG_00758 [Trichophyton tonsurans CBS 112818]|uniref:Uncharacterized protein n=1 Tax=Trichophyton tonsurans (strain CBS 112818) TaxID=647933 RepID=F2RPF3_TRIT1|nr:hypothetical protein TESG_00758 [Trichophyton tonsurans CBS 112818]